MAWRLPRRTSDYLPDMSYDRLGDYVDPRNLEDYLPFRSCRWPGRRRDNTELTIAVGVGAAAMIGLLAGAFLMNRDRILGDNSRDDGPDKPSATGN